MLHPQDPAAQGGPSRSGELVPTSFHEVAMPVSAGMEVIPYSDAPPAPDPGHGMLAGLLRRKWLIFGVFSLIALAILPFIWTQVKPQYRSTAVIKVEPVLPTLIADPKDDNIGMYPSYLNTQVGVMRSPKVLSRVLDKPRVQGTFWYREEGAALMGGRIPAQERLPDDLTVLPRPQTYFIDISMYTQRPEDARLIVDAVADSYIQFNQETRNDERAQTLETLRQERDQLNFQINSKLAQMHLLSRQIGTLDSSELRSKLRTDLSRLESKRDELAREIRIMGDRLETLADGGAHTRPASDTQPAESKGPYYAGDPEWRSRKLALDHARGELSALKLGRGGGNIAVRQSEMRAQLAEAQLKEREEQIQEEIRRGAKSFAAASPDDPEALRLDLDLKKKEQEYLEQDYTKRRKQVNETSEVAMKVAEHEQDLSHLRDLYREYQRRIEVLESEIKAPARVNIMSYGGSSSRPDRDRRFLFTAMSLAAALGVALSVGYLRASTDRKIHEIAEVSGAGHAPFLGKLPRVHRQTLPAELGGEPTAMRQTWIEAADRAQHALMERMRMVRTALLERVGETGEKVLLITSSQSESGKSSVAVLLARTLSVIGKSVLLVEGDLRRPTLGQRLSIDTPYGLAAVLTGRATDEQAVEGSRHLPFRVIAAGEMPEDFDLELLSNGAFSGCVQRWRRTYDFVLVDSPPVLPVADARILAGHADGAIMVVRAGHDRRPDAVEAFSLLSAAGGKLVGTVFIAPEVRRGTEYGYGYTYGSGNGYGVYGRSLNGGGQGAAGERAQPSV